jgi:hypothetical protein
MSTGRFRALKTPAADEIKAECCFCEQERPNLDETAAKADCFQVASMKQ